MTRIHFDRGIKLLKRFLKEEGLYIAVFQNYIFRNKRPIDNLFNEFNSATYHQTDWCHLFERVNLITGYYWTFNYPEYYTLILRNNIRYKWSEFYRKNVLYNVMVDIDLSAI